MIATLYPDCIVTRTKTDPIHYAKKWELDMLERYRKKHHPEQDPHGKSINSLKNLRKHRSTYALSRQTKRAIKYSVLMLNHLTKPRTIWFTKAKPIYNFRCSFVTLTLPAEQQHPDTEIKSVCLNNFLNNLRHHYKLKNYVWVAELQQNQNLHFHLVFDQYIHHSAIRYYWNRSLELLGYVTAYHKKFSKMTLQQYADYRNISVPDAARAYARGRDSDWKSPPTEQVIAVQNQQQLAGYLYKYLAKPARKESEPEQLNDDDLGRLAAFGRSWGRSQSLAKLEFITRYDWESLKAYVFQYRDAAKFLIKRAFDYVTVYYFDFRKMPSEFKIWLNRKMVEIGITFGYYSAADP